MRRFRKVSAIHTIQESQRKAMKNVFSRAKSAMNLNLQQKEGIESEAHKEK